MTVFSALYQVIMGLPFGRCRKYTGDDLKFHVSELLHRKPNAKEFQEAIKAAKLCEELFFTSSTRGYYRTKVKENWKDKSKSLSRQIENRLIEQHIIQRRING
jgi:hypothetical protein